MIYQLVDWEAQWASFAENFYDGKAHIDLAKFGGSSELLLLPGPGFGDLSHPTTHLMLQLMKEKVWGRNIIDIGCGSGILGLAALKLGALSLLGIDIDPDAIQHAHNNMVLNQLDAVFCENIPEGACGNQILLMNMILPEQKIVMEQKAQLNSLAGNWITSGILASQREEYYALTKQWGWRLKSEIQQGEWLGLVFDVSKKASPHFQ
jgi:ribosomal protein L11 methyltransferase